MHVPFPWEALDRLPRHPDWKYEYWDGELHLSHRAWPVEVSRPVDGPLAVPPEAEAPAVRLLHPDEEQDAVRSFLRAEWWEEPPYQTYDEELRQRVLDDDLRRTRWPTPSAPGAVAEEDGVVVGTLLTSPGRAKDEALTLTWLTVTFQQRERGTATAMLAVLLAELSRIGETELRSGFSVANEPSLRWHLRRGFEIVPDTIRRGWRPRDLSSLIERDTSTQEAEAP